MRSIEPIGQDLPSALSISACTSFCTGWMSLGLPTTSMREAGCSTKLSSGMTDRIARAARGQLASMRSSLPSTVWRATESDGKLVSLITSVSPWPMARSA